MRREGCEEVSGIGVGGLGEEVGAVAGLFEGVIGEGDEAVEGGVGGRSVDCWDDEGLGRRRAEG
jgi:hypothetical protein